MTTSPLTSRERLRRCYCHEEQDRPGIYFRTNWPSDPSYDPVKACVTAHTDLKITVDLQSLDAPPPTTVERRPHSEDFAAETPILHAPGGDLRSTTLVGLRLLPGFCQEPFI